jgi:hypothetical protein
MNMTLKLTISATIFAWAIVVVHPAAAEIVAVRQADVVVLNNGPAAGVEQQFRAQFEPLLKVELSFANRVCKLSDDQRRNLIGKCNAWLTKFIRDYAKQGGQPMVQGAWFGGGRPQLADPRESVQKGVAKIIKAELPKEQTAVYVEETKKRADFSQQVSVDNLVARIDNELILSPEQREKISKSLFDHWDKAWAPQLEMFMHGMDMWPNVPDQWIRPHLTATQQVAWGRLHKQHGNVFFGGMGNEGQVIDDIDLKEADDEKADGRTTDVGGDKRASAISVAPRAAN